MRSLILARIRNPTCCIFSGLKNKILISFNCHQAIQWSVLFSHPMNLVESRELDVSIFSHICSLSNESGFSLSGYYVCLLPFFPLSVFHFPIKLVCWRLIIIQGTRVYIKGLRESLFQSPSKEDFSKFSRLMSLQIF